MNISLLPTDMITYTDIFLYTVISLIITVLLAGYYVSLSVIFTKAGEKPWKAIIPLYNQYILFKTSWSVKGFLIGLLAQIIYLVGFIPLTVKKTIILYGQETAKGIGILTFITLIGALFLTLIYFILYVKLSSSFGKKDIFALGLLFLTPVFLMILAFKDSKYEGISDRSLEDLVDLSCLVKRSKHEKEDDDEEARRYINSFYGE